MDTIETSISSYVKYEEEVFLSSEKYSDNVIGPLQDDQAKVKLPWYESTSVSGKVWVKDNDTWKKAKKIYVDTLAYFKNNKLKEDFDSLIANKEVLDISEYAC